MRATSENLEGNRVKLSVEVDETEVEKVVDDTFRRMAREIRVPGFRPGKVPRRLLESRLGRGNLRLEAIQDALPDFYARALRDTEVDAIAPPEIDITDGKESGAVLFDAVVQVRPVVSVAGYDGLVVTIPRPAMREQDVDAQVDRLRDVQARLEPVDRPAVDGDQVTVDVSARRDGDPVANLTSQAMVYEVGRGDLIEGLDPVLRGAKVGDILSFEGTATGDDSPATFTVLVKQVAEKHLPEADDAWAAENSEFETIAALREDLGHRLHQVRLAATRMALRDRALNALVSLVAEDPPDVLVDAEVERRIHELGHRLEAQGISLEQYVAATGGADNLLAEAREGAADAAKGDLALRSLADALAIEVTEEDLGRELLRMSEGIGQPPEELRDQLEQGDRLAELRSELRKSKALDWLSEQVALVDEEGNTIDRSELEPPAGSDSAGSDEGGQGERDPGAVATATRTAAVPLAEESTTAGAEAGHGEESVGATATNVEAEAVQDGGGDVAPGAEGAEEPISGESTP